LGEGLFAMDLAGQGFGHLHITFTCVIVAIVQVIVSITP
jgi:hypothetical protein